jgi:hypothetical protein
VNRRYPDAVRSGVTSPSASRNRIFEIVTSGKSPGQEHEAELADLHLVAVGQYRGVHRLAVHVGTVEAAHVDDLELGTLEAELRVAAAHRDVIEEDVAVGMPARRGGGLVEQEPRPRVRPALDDQKGGPDRQTFHTRHCALAAGGGRSVELIEEVGAEHRCRLHGDFIRVGPRVEVLVRHPLLLTGCRGDSRPDPQQSSR